jgi:hypothetical protein
LCIWPFFAFSMGFQGPLPFYVYKRHGP